MFNWNTKNVTKLVLVIFSGGKIVEEGEILECEKGPNEFKRIERGTVCGKNLIYDFVVYINLYLRYEKHKLRWVRLYLL